MNKSICLLLLLVLLMPLVSLSKANFFPPPPSLPHVYIRSDGILDPETLPIQRVENVYTFTEEMANFTLEIQRSNIVVDGAGYALKGNGSGQGLVLSNLNNVTIKNLQLRNFREGINIASSSNCTITGATVTENELGVYLYSSSNNVIERSNITSNSGDGIVLLNGCNYNRIFENQIAGNGNGGVNLESGEKMWNYSNNDYNNIIGNNITANAVYGIWILSSQGCRIERNNISNSQWGMQLHGSTCQNNTVVWNNIASCRSYGMILAGGFNHNTIAKNTLMGNGVGIDILASENNQFYHNNLINNNKQVDNHYVDASNFTGIPSILPSVNTWDNGSSSGGNYWSDYNGKDENHDGFGDAPYIIDANNTDHYPLMKTFGLVTGYILPSPSPSASPIKLPIELPSPSTNSAPTPNPQPTSTVPIEVTYTIAATVSILVVATAFMLRKRKTSKQTTQ